MSDKILISEIFGPTIQGEGVLLGKPTIFVRSGGCDFRCVWCDTGYAVLPKHKDTWHKMTVMEILDKVDELADGTFPIITLSGGNPALQPFQYLVSPAHQRRYNVALETQGSKPKEWFELLNYLILSPKPPSSEMEFDKNALRECIMIGSHNTTLKVVVFDEEDYKFARSIHREYPYLPMYLSTGNKYVGIDQEPKTDIQGLLDQTKIISEWVLKDSNMSNVFVTPQLHTLLWGGQRGY